MHPAGHLLTASGLGLGLYAASGSPELGAGAFAGGFLIDADHYFDYLVLDRQTSLDPRRFLRYCLEGRLRTVLLVLHSYELLALLGLAALATGAPWLGGYWLGAAMHLGLDIGFNGRLIRDPVRFYAFAYRLRRRFRASALLAPPTPGRPVPDPALAPALPR